MAPSNKTTESRRKSGGKPSLVVTLNITPSRLRELVEPESIKEETPIDEPKAPESPAKSATPAAPVISNGEIASDSNAATPAAEVTGTPAPSVTEPLVEGSKKKGTKRSAPATDTPGDGTPKPRGKPGPKKKPRLYEFPHLLLDLAPLSLYCFSSPA
jgi:hypothetical protein